ncbi:peptidase inhibitor family I36 protein [Streptomyces sp. NPDC004610]|uniref:peptidase inhibitor family I36 protein n=1 Tax=unclassified Streptomyces TaxID=2593676 RepID=UPI0033B4F073
MRSLPRTGGLPLGHSERTASSHSRRRPETGGDRRHAQEDRGARRGHGGRPRTHRADSGERRGDPGHQGGGRGGPVPAHRAWSECGSGSCFFPNDNGGGWLWVVPSCGHHPVPGWFQDRASSAWNRTPTRIHIYKHTDYGGYLGTVPAWFQGNLASADEDVMSSVFADC